MARVKSTPNVKRIFSPPKPFDGFFERLAAAIAAAGAAALL